MSLRSTVTIPKRIHRLYPPRHAKEKRKTHPEDALRKRYSGMIREEDNERGRDRCLGRPSESGESVGERGPQPRGL